jgi:hypothetical protein
MYQQKLKIAAIIAGVIAVTIFNIVADKREGA